MGEIGFVSGLYRFVDVGHFFLSSSPHSKVNHPNITQLLAVTLTSEPTTLILVRALSLHTPCIIHFLSLSLLSFMYMFNVLCHHNSYTHSH
jgi:hypothetical protein